MPQATLSLDLDQSDRQIQGLAWQVDPVEELKLQRWFFSNHVRRLLGRASETKGPSRGVGQGSKSRLLAKPHQVAIDTVLILSNLLSFHFAHASTFGCRLD